MNKFYRRTHKSTLIGFLALGILSALVWNTFSDSSRNSDQNIRLLLISKSITNADILEAAALDSVVVISYDPANTSLEKLSIMMRQAVAGRKASSIGIATHDFGEARFYLTGSQTVSLGSLLVSGQQRAFWRDLATLSPQNGRIDLFACNLASGKQGLMLVSVLADITGREIAASSDDTGHPESGGNWELETSGIDAASTYFDRNRLSDFHGLLTSETKKINSSDEASGDRFGWSVSIYRNTAIVGAYLDDHSGLTDAGSAYIFYRNMGGKNNWGQVAKLTASDAANNDQFGGPVGVWKNTAIVGAWSNDHSGHVNAGAAYIFDRNQGGKNNWGQVKKIIQNDPKDNHRFGLSVGISESTAVVGAWADDDAASLAGAAYTFDRHQGGKNNWGQVKKLFASDAAVNDFFGREVAIYHNTIVVGADGADLPRATDAGTTTDAGAAYVFYRDEGGLNNWGQVKKLIAPDASNGDVFGRHISIYRYRVLISSSFDDHSGLTDAGSAYIFNQNLGGANNWGVEKKLIASDAADNDFFGGSVCLFRNTAIVGAANDDHNGFNDAGSAYVFIRNVGGLNNWGEDDKLTASDAAANDIFGSSVAIFKRYILVGAPFDQDFGGASGSIYYFGPGSP